MHAILHLNRFYNWEPVPRDVTVTPVDVASGKVMPDRNGGYRMRVVRQGPTFLTCCITESIIIAKIIHEKTDVRRRAGRTFTRKQAVAHVIMEHLLDGAAEWAWITSVEVHDDGPDEKLFREMLEPHTKSFHGRTGNLAIDPKDVRAHVAAYMEPATAKDHAEHLTQHFGTKAVS